jgi:LAO/AO transport system kinase
LATDLGDHDLLSRALAGVRDALARAISRVENEAPGSIAILNACFEKSGRAYRVGVTGPPGAGKSTLVLRLAQEYRRRGETVAIVAVDPTSPFSGGALLGDRVRMGELSGDPGVFIAQACDVLDAAGFARILIETVGVGQSELEVAQTADTTVVVMVPESGDTVQAMKAGLMEIGDLFVVNKADRDGADRAAFAIQSALELRAVPAEWPTPVLQTVASLGNGIGELADRLEEHLEFLKTEGGLDRRRRRRAAQRLESLLRDRLWGAFRARVSDAAWHEALESLAAHRLTPHQAAERLLHGSHSGPDGRNPAEGGGAHD